MSRKFQSILASRSQYSLPSEGNISRSTNINPNPCDRYSSQSALFLTYDS
ncbi:MAG: hypothetical protein HC903_08225 [Methylacidiphilales bacterium]|nr:hypothetical protein [Candidatus Methylacidiphilales bacterium]NJR15704.1 hypothetical protein [Calothrix sp. CSU_2_0]